MLVLRLLSAVVTTAAITLSPVFAFPNAPFHTDGRWIKDSTSAKFTYVGINWPGAGEVMVPEGLQYQSISSIVSKIKSSGFNSIRLTFAAEMVDQIYANGGTDIPINKAFIKALGPTNGTKILQGVLLNNPSFSEKTTRLQVFDAIAKECANQGIYIHLDNHISKGQWCCSSTDGNGWFGDTHFDVANWTRALSHMSSHAASWSNFVSIGLRNELRATPKNSQVQATYNWKTWYSNMIAAADVVHKANPDILIFFSGLNYDTTLSPIPTASDLGGGIRFKKSNFAYSNKIVLELHKYGNSDSVCSSTESGLYNAGFNALNSSNPSIVNVMPVVLTEFGHKQDTSSVKGMYSTCLRSYMPSLKAGWMAWVLAGSYYTRSGVQDMDETWGLLNHNWSEYRSAAVFESGLGKMIKASLSSK